MIRVFIDSNGPLLESAGTVRRPAGNFSLDDLFTAAQPSALAQQVWATGRPATMPASLAAPIGTQEVWAAGVTYLRSRTARMEESKDAGGGPTATRRSRTGQDATLGVPTSVIPVTVAAVTQALVTSASDRSLSTVRRRSPSMGRAALSAIDTSAPVGITIRQPPPAAITGPARPAIQLRSAARLT